MESKLTRENYLSILQNLKKSSLLSYNDIARITKMSRAHIQKVLTGTIKNPTQKSIERVFNALND